MAEKRRGLGRGLGALIPDVVTDDRPVDVFFPSQKDAEGVSRETSDDRASRDPAVGMRRARTERKAAGGVATGASGSKKKASSSGSRAAKATAETESSASSGTVRSGSTSDAKPAAGRRGATGTSDSAGVPAVADSSRSEASATGSHDVSRETSLTEVPGTAFGMIPVERISANPQQPRTVFDEDALDELVHSIREVGVLQPIVVRVTDPDAPAYELIMGERRLRASRSAGLESIPAIIREVKDVDLLRDALLENLHRADLNPLEEAAAYRQLLDDFQCTQDELSERIGRSRPQITNTLRLLKLPPLVQRRVAAGVLSQGHARAILGLEDGAQMESLAQRVVAEGLSVRATEEAVVLAQRGDAPTVSRETPAPDPALQSLARTLGDRLDTRVNITMGKRKGKISVEFANNDDLQRILNALGVERSEGGEE